jgi:predicted ATPase
MNGEPAPHPVPFVRSVRVTNYRSIAACDVEFGALTVLLGFNAAGKSNFLDVLRFVADALETSPALAAAGRGGLETLLHRSPAEASEFFGIGLGLNLRLPAYDRPIRASYGFEIGADPTGETPLLVRSEFGVIDLPAGPARLSLAMPGRSSRLRLPASAIDEDSPQAILESALRAMRFYDLDSAILREVDEQPPRNAYLGPAGEHLGRVLGAIAADEAGKERLDAYLSALVPGALGVDERQEGRYSTVQARFRGGDGAGEAVFLRESLSEGTLRAAGTLAALLQPPTANCSLIAIEEPETALHPAGVSALYEALDDAVTHTQVIVASQSSDLLDSEYADIDHIRAVANIDGVTRIGPVDAAGRAVVDKGLMSLAELHRSGQLRPEIEDASR